MCLIIRCEIDKPLSKELLKDMQSRNDDGFGFMWIQNNRINTFKDSTNNFNILWDKYNELKEFNPFIHLRFKTHGAIDHTNTHPYPCGHGIYLMHNGIINIKASSDNTKSDTWHFIDQLIKPIIQLVPNPHQMIRSKNFRKIVEQAMGSSNRIVLGDRGGFIVFNEKTWHTISNEKTDCVGLLVSNTYAWDAFGFGHPKKPINYNYQAPHQTFNYMGKVWDSERGWEDDQSDWMTRKPHPPSVASSTPLPTAITSMFQMGSPSKGEIGKERTIKWHNKEYFQVFNTIYEDDQGFMYMNNGHCMKRRPDLDAAYGELSAKVEQKQLPLVIATKQEAVDLGLMINDAEAELVVEITEQDYERALVKEWCLRKPYEINTMVYSEPDEAAKVLNHLIAHNVH